MEISNCYLNNDCNMTSLLMGCLQKKLAFVCTGPLYVTTLVCFFKASLA